MNNLKLARTAGIGNDVYWPTKNEYLKVLAISSKNEVILEASSGYAFIIMGNDHDLSLSKKDKIENLIDRIRTNAILMSKKANVDLNNEWKELGIEATELKNQLMELIR
jgi:hypothetical protein